MKSLMNFLMTQDITILKSLFNKINEFRKVKCRKDEKKEKKIVVNDTVSELNRLLNRFLN